MSKRKKRHPPPPPPSHPQGRKTRLTPEVQEQIVGYVLEGNYFSTACELAGIPAKTGKDWLVRGRGDDPDRADSEPFASFAVAVTQAQAQAERDAIARIKEAAQGRRVIRSKTVRKVYRDPEGNENAESTTEIVETTNYDWRADAWILEHRHPERWGNQRMAEIEAWKVLIEAGQVPEAVIDALLEGEQERRDRIQSALKPDHGTP